MISPANYTGQYYFPPFIHLLCKHCAFFYSHFIFALQVFFVVICLNCIHSGLISFINSVSWYKLHKIVMKSAYFMKEIFCFHVRKSPRPRKDSVCFSLTNESQNEQKCVKMKRIGDEQRKTSHEIVNLKKKVSGTLCFYPVYCYHTTQKLLKRRRCPIAKSLLQQ